jgi:kynurenine formamidase
MKPRNDSQERVYGAVPAPICSSELLGLIKRGSVYDLSNPMKPDTPYAATTSPFSVRMNQRHSDDLGMGSFGEATEILTMSSHTATHLDALCHISEKASGHPMLYGDLRASEAASELGFKELGIERCPPVIIRGLALDLPFSKGMEVLPDSYGVSESDVATCCEMEGVEIKPGDGVLIRTGFSKYRHTDQARFGDLGAGPTPATCRWLAEKGAVLVGSDTMAFERYPSPHLGHIELIRRRGIPILKQVNLDGVAADHVYQFLLIILPLRLVGATASPVTPVAIC